MITWFWILAALIVYTYVGYPAIIVLLSKVYSQKRKSIDGYTPKVSWVVPSYNEESIIVEKIKNVLSLDYPKELLEIIVITDGSTDNTPKLAGKFPEVKVLHQEQRRGKSAAENRAMKHITGEIVVFNDANTVVAPGALLSLVRHYADPKVGGVSGAKGIIIEEKDGAESRGEGLYWKYESAIKKADSAVNSLMGAAGELVSFRSNLVMDLPEDTILDDFMQSFYILKQGKHMLYEPNAKAEERSSSSIEEELKRKIRIAAGGWQSIVRLRFMLNVFTRPVQSWMYVSHRVLRWTLTPFALPVLLLLNLGLVAESSSGLYLVLALGQLAFYAIALMGHLKRHQEMPGAVTAIYYFTVMNYSAIVGFFRFLRRSQSASWERSQRK